MADTPDTPTSTASAKPTTRRRATRAPAAKAPVKKPAAPKPQSAAKPEAAPKAEAAPKRPTTPKPRSTKRATPAPKRKAPAKSAATKSEEATSGKWSAAAIAGGVAAIGAVATAALLTLRSSTPKPKGGAHTADGSDASKSFEAGIADEGTIPDKV